MMRSLLITALLFAPFFSSAQLLSDNPLGNQTSLVLFPSYPSPEQSFTVSLDDYSGGAYGASIDWYLNNQEQPALKNTRSITLTAGKAGDTLEIEAVLSIPNGPRQTVAAIVQPRYLDIIFEPQTHIPSFYKGRALPSSGSIVNATAILHGTGIANENLIYTWRVGNEVLNAGPVRGGNEVSFTVPSRSEMIVTLEVTDASARVLARRSLSVPIATPELHFYEMNTLYGINSRSLSSLLLVGNSATIRAVPYYLDSRVYNQPDIVVWEINNEEYSSQSGNPYEITLQRMQTGGSSGLGFHVRSTTNFLQGAKSNLVVNY